MTKKRIILIISCISAFLLCFSILNTIKIEKQETNYKSKIESLDKKYIKKIDLLAKELGEKVDTEFDLNQLYYEDSFYNTISYLEDSADKYRYLINQISALNKEYKKLYNDNKVPDEYVYEHTQMIELLDEIEDVNGNNPDIESIKESRNSINSVKEVLFNNCFFTLRSNFLGFKNRMTGNLAKDRKIALEKGFKGFLEYRSDLMEKLDISDYYRADYLINAKYYTIKNIKSTVPEYYKSQIDFIDNNSTGNNSNDKNIMISVLTEVDNLNYAIHEKEYNDVVEQYTDISTLAKNSVNKINNYIEDVNDDELKEIINMYRMAFDKYYKAYNRALNSLDNYSPEEESIIKEMMDEATLDLENVNISYDKYKQN